jgi:hypothetical protein
MTTTNFVQAQAQTQTRATVRSEWLYVGLFALALLILTFIPYAYAYWFAPPDKTFMGVAFNIPDHYQYFSWMREARTNVLVANQLTPEPSTPLLFNFLWFLLARIELLTGLDYLVLYQITRWIAGAFAIFATYYFCSLIFCDRLKRWTAFLIGVLAGGVGWIWVLDKYIGSGADIIFPRDFDVYTAEPNTFFSVLAFPHFSIAVGLIAIIFGLVLQGQRTKKLSYAWWAAAVSLLLAVQHSYDLFTIYGVIAVYALFLLIRDRAIPWYMVKLGLIVGFISCWPALQAFYITTADPVWKGVLSQFDNAGAWTPPPYRLPILMGVAWALAIWALNIRKPWKERSDTHLFIMAWFLSHFFLIYLPLNFQIHLLSGWQVIIGVLATIGLYTRVLPWLGKRFANVKPQRLALYASAVLIALVVPVNLYILGWRLLDLRRAENPYFARTTEVAALDYLETQVNADDVVLASLDIGQYVPARTGARAFIAHWAQTLDFYGKDAMVNAFFDPATSDAERQRILREYSVDYVFYSPEEAALGAYDPADADFLQEVFADGDTRVYQVLGAEVASR